MVTSVSDARNRLEELIQLVDQGEEVDITVSGVVKARLTAPPRQPEFDRETHLAMLKEAVEGANAGVRGEPRNTPQSFWDELREDRF